MQSPRRDTGWRGANPSQKVLVRFAYDWRDSPLALAQFFVIPLLQSFYVCVFLRLCFLTSISAQIIPKVTQVVLQLTSNLESSVLTIKSLKSTRYIHF